MQIRLQRFGIDQPWADAVDRHVVWQELAHDRGDCARERQPRSLAVRESDLRELYETHGDADDTAKSALAHAGRVSADQIERGMEMGLHPVVPCLPRHGPKIVRRLTDARIGDEYVRIRARNHQSPT